ncbi:MAG TPA: type III-A CRISPR-associated RAMP protein Csm3 [Candidatus Latescibacteria bacterium]|nr:type III-A CRISPR-associated RAMP protein Csm3 [Candidatus Latescibacterota bacterium]HOS66074.1 type III-A CRISPR-associated RAMP protein Csm3 [Candidatus Latescibacterota bacterium]HPK76015.1 type III-A CRISPR-associated RAMP protein Csm3 [Candidatus Latescibacterota bacterium]
MEMQYLGNVVLRGKIKCLTGLHVGGSEEKYEIGGMDNPVIKHPLTGYAYIPGSSLKGKLRSLTEWALGVVEIKFNEDARKFEAPTHSCGKADCAICAVFGCAILSGKEQKLSGPSRLLVRDSFPTEETRRQMDSLEKNHGLPKVEVKSENSLDRVTSEANPRPLERVHAGAEFDMELVYGVYDRDGDGGKADIENIGVVLQALRLLEDSSLGGGGSRGSGQVRVHLEATPVVKPVKDYLEGTSVVPAEVKTVPLSEIKKDAYTGAIKL